MIVWIIVLGVILMGLITVLAMTFTKANPTFLYVFTIVMALILLFVEIIMLSQSLYKQQGLMYVYIVATIIVAIVLGIALFAGGYSGHKGRRQARIETVNNGRPPRTGHRALRTGQSASRAGRRGRR